MDRIDDLYRRHGAYEYDNGVNLRAVAALPIAQRQAVVLVDWLGFPPSEAALLLGIEAASVRGRLHRARLELRRQVGGNDA